MVRDIEIQKKDALDFEMDEKMVAEIFELTQVFHPHANQNYEKQQCRKVGK